MVLWQIEYQVKIGEHTTSRQLAAQPSALHNKSMIRFPWRTGLSRVCRQQEEAL
ncbi:hypothetical protein [Streptosporangium sp. CA-115845]|uniref:hypothetical protein n=1 Tax=Streptosporangium sp. CA-115845 TaxID=3240071 RepID=UPI003D8B4669